MKTKLITSLCAAALVSAGSVKAITNVGLELALLVDVSSSIDPTEYNLQLDAYEAAFRNPLIHTAISNTPGGIAVSYTEWAGRLQDGLPVSPVMRVGWTMITDAASSNAFADLLLGLPAGKQPGLGPFTHVKGAIEFGANAIHTNDFEGERKVMDISGDGKDNFSLDPTHAPNTDFDATGLLVQAAANAAIASGIDAINGLPIITPAVDAVNLDVWYDTYVKAGTDAFIVTANGFEDFRAAIVEKLGREIPPPPTVPDNGTTVALMGLGLLALASARRWRTK